PVIHIGVLDIVVQCFVLKLFNFGPEELGICFQAWPSSSHDFFQDRRQSVTLFWQRRIAPDESAHFHEVSSHMNTVDIREEIFIHGHVWATVITYGVTSQYFVVALG